MSMLDCPKTISALDSVFRCLKCEVCNEVASSPIPGLCSKHLFCNACAHKTSMCPVCKVALNVEKINTSFNLASEILPLLNSFKESIIEPAKQQVQNKKSEQKPAKDTKINEKLLEKKQAIKESPAVSNQSKISTGRRSLVGSGPDLNKRNKKGETLLHVACNKGKLDEVQRLVSGGARCATKDYAGWTPLHEVAQQGRLDIARLLLQHGAKANVPGGQLNTPLHEAVITANSDVVRLLMEFGAKPDQRNLYGVTPRAMTKDTALTALMANVTEEVTSSSSCDDSESLLSSDCRHLVVMEEGLNRTQRAILASLSKTLSIQRTNAPSADVRLVITPTKNNICERSVAVLTGLALGAWVVGTEWLETCEKTEYLVDPEPFEVYGTVNSTRGDVPKLVRLNFKNLMPGLFAGCHIYFATAVNLDGGLDRDTLSRITRLAGAQVLSRSPDPEDIPEGERTVPFHAHPGSTLAECSHFLIYQSGPREPLIKYNMKHIKSLPHTWLLDCIENFSLIDP